MNPRDLNRLVAHLKARYQKRTRKSLAVHHRAEKVMVRGGSHTLRLYYPYPFQIASAQGAWVKDVDGNAYLDYWQGHYANILGHNPAAIRSALKTPASRGSLHTGFESESQIELAELIIRQLGDGDLRVRFTTSGTLATMYAVMLALAHTGRDLVLKIGGGWHGASPFLLKGIRYDSRLGFHGPASAGIPQEIFRRTLVTPFNDGQALENLLKRKGKSVACFILEPFLGVGGFLPASREYLELARRLTERYGIVLIFDEIISGFRFCPSGVQTLYGVRPDLSTFGKLIGGGHTIAAVVGRRNILERCETRANSRLRVLFEGGTFSSHPEYIRSGLAMLRTLIAQARQVYPRLAAQGESLRRGIEAAFRTEGVEAICTGNAEDVLPGSSMFMVHFPRRPWPAPSPEILADPHWADLSLREEVLKLALLVEGVHAVHGGGAVSTAHTAGQVRQTLQAYAQTARLFKKYL
ncbi:MAG TPA: aminotransferase class III-fold pyridoxal phosphate-dependent enzyme [Acidobacteriota bacterium]